MLAGVAAEAPAAVGLLLLSTGPRSVDRLAGTLFVVSTAAGYWLFALRPRLTLQAGRLAVQNPLRRHELAMSEVLGARAGSGIVIDVRPNRTVVASSALTRPAHVQGAQAVRVGKMSSQNASPEQPTGRNQVSGTLKWHRGQEAHRAHATA